MTTALLTTILLFALKQKIRDTSSLSAGTGRNVTFITAVAKKSTTVKMVEKGELMESNIDALEVRSAVCDDVC